MSIDGLLSVTPRTGDFLGVVNHQACPAGEYSACPAPCRVWREIRESSTGGTEIGAFFNKEIGSFKNHSGWFFDLLRTIQDVFLVFQEPFRMVF